MLPPRATPPGIALALLGCLGCAEESARAPAAEPAQAVAFASEGAEAARAAACAQTYDNPTRLGAGAEPMNASNLWSVTPYLVLLPATGDGFVNLSVDAPHFDWLLYTQQGVSIESMADPDVESGGAVAACPERGIVEFGAHHHAISDWPLRLTGEPSSRIELYVALSPTEHSDLEHAGHAGHDLSGDAEGSHDHTGEY